MFLYMSKKNKNAQQNNMNQMNYNPLISNVEQKGILETNKKNLKDLIAPAGIDASHTNHLEIISNKKKYARTMIVSTIPRMCTFQNS